MSLTLNHEVNMESKKLFPNTYESFNSLNRETCTEEQGYYTFKSKEGRLKCGKQIALTPISIPAQILKRICKLAIAIFQFLGHCFEYLEFKERKIEIVKDKEKIPTFKDLAINIADCALSTLVTPAIAVVERIRYIAGIIHPGAVYKSNVANDSKADSPKGSKVDSPSKNKVDSTIKDVIDGVQDTANETSKTVTKKTKGAGQAFKGAGNKIKGFFSTNNK